MKISCLALASLIAVAACGQARTPDRLIPKLEQLASRGNGEALYHLGMAYWTGTGVEKDQRNAVDYFRRAAAVGDPLGAYKLGCLYDGQDNMMKRDAKEALRHKKMAADAGYALAQQDVAALYAQKGDFGTAIGWLEKAARQGTSDALLAFSSVHNGAPGIEPDPVKTAAFFRLHLDRIEASSEQRVWLKTFEERLTAGQRAEAARIVATYRPQPTALTIKALRGVESAREFAAAH